jgi:hypothetical protein
MKKSPIDAPQHHVRQEQRLGLHRANQRTAYRGTATAARVWPESSVEIAIPKT